MKNITSKERNKYGLLAGITGIIINLFLGAIKLIAGILTNSISIITDSVNNITDTISSVITLIGFKLSNKKPDQKHPYGYARYEYISALLVAIFMLLTGMIFAKESILKIINPKALTITNITFLILIIAIIGKIALLLIYKNYYKKTESKTLKTNIIDTRNDILTTTAILISMITMKITNINIDGFLGLLVSLFIIISSIKTLKEVLEPIIGTIPNEKQITKIKNKLLSYDYVQGIHDLVIHNYGVKNDFITVHIEIDSKIDTIKAHDLIDNIENDFKKENINLTIHMDPVIIGDPKIDKIKNKIEKQIEKLGKDLSIHDIRVIKGKNTTKILFDCVIPYENKITKEEIKKYLETKIKSKTTKYEFIIEIDRPFC